MLSLFSTFIETIKIPKGGTSDKKTALLKLLTFFKIIALDVRISFQLRK
jgi:hypothetical protein